MSKIGKLALRLLMLLMTIAAVLFIFEGEGLFLGKSSAHLRKYIIQDKVEDLTLTMYFRNPSLLVQAPWRVEQLTKDSDWSICKIVINGDSLKEKTDILTEMCNVELIPVKEESSLDARIYYVFKTKRDREVFDVALYGWRIEEGSSMFVNGTEVERNDVMEKIFSPYWSDEVREYFKQINKTADD